jgi:hypothetical protein
LRAKQAKDYTMSHVFVIDTDKQPLAPVHSGRARLLLKAGRAAVYRRNLFTLILKRPVEQPSPASLRLKIDPGAKTTGLALVNDATGHILWATELTHRGEQIKKALDKRRGVHGYSYTKGAKHAADLTTLSASSSSAIAPSPP